MTEIKISYSAKPKGQIGPRPQKIDLNESCVFTCTDPGTLTIEFVNGSPTHTARIGKDEKFVAARSGHFKFKCTLTPPGGAPITLGDPDDPNSVAGGEIEIGL